MGKTIMGERETQKRIPLLSYRCWNTSDSLEIAKPPKRMEDSKYGG